MYNDNLFALKIDRKTKADCMKKKVLKINYYNYISRTCAEFITYYRPLSTVGGRRDVSKRFYCAIP